MLCPACSHSCVLTPSFCCANRKIVGEILHNYGNARQLDLSVGVGYGTNIQDAVTLVKKILTANQRVLKQPDPVVGVSLLADFSVNIAVKPWVKVDDFVAAGPEINQSILEEFRLRGIEIPFPQREVRLLNGNVAQNSPDSIRAEARRL